MPSDDQELRENILCMLMQYEWRAYEFEKFQKGHWYLFVS